MLPCLIHAGAGLRKVGAAAPQLRNLDRQQTSSTAVLATTGPNLLNHGSLAVTIGLSHRYFGGWGCVVMSEAVEDCRMSVQILRSFDPLVQNSITQPQQQMFTCDHVSHLLWDVLS